VIPHRCGDAGAGQRFGVALGEGVDAEDGRQQDDAGLGRRIGLREKAEQAGLLDLL